jgi:hypothetical protein
MGVYVDTVRAEHIDALLYGQPVKIHAIKYLFKPYYVGFNDELRRTQKMALVRTENYWGRRELPKYVAFSGDGFEPGMDVIAWKGGFLWYDCDKVPGETVGTLIAVPDNSRKGFHWGVEPCMLEINPT